MFPTFGRHGRKGAKVPRHAKNFLIWRIQPIADRLTFQVMRRTLGTDLQQHGTMKDIQGALRHASIKTAGDVYVQPIPSSVRAAINARTEEILAGSKTETISAWQPEGTAKTPDAMQPNATQLENSSFASA